jgi:hypothetical protein
VESALMQRAFNDFVNDEPLREQRMLVGADIAGREEFAIDIVHCDTDALDLDADQIFLVDLIDTAHVMPLFGHELAAWW